MHLLYIVIDIINALLVVLPLFIFAVIQ